MEECFICDVSGDKERLFHAVHHEHGVIAVCEKCAIDENLPVIKKPTTFQLKDSEKPAGNTYERLSKTAGINPEEHRLRHKVEQQELERKKRREELTKEEIGLKEIIERNLKIKTPENKPRPNLVDNFHWIIMRARRRKSLTKEQLAEKISESVVVLEMAEKGVLPEDDFRLVNKLENFLGIRIKKENQPAEPDEKKLPARIVNFKQEAVQNLTISDLQEMKKRRERAILGEEVEEKAAPEEIEIEEDAEPEEW